MSADKKRAAESEEVEGVELDPRASLMEDVQKLLAANESDDAEHAMCKELSASVSNLVRTAEEDGVRLADAERSIRGLTEELLRANVSIERIEADRDSMRKAFDQRYAEIVQAYDDAETGFIERPERMATLNLAQSKHMANQKQELKKDKD